jgi:nitrile hydratase subunit beta
MTPPRFREGDRVRVPQQRIGGNPRTPHYVRGSVGVVTAVHGVIDNPLDHRHPYPPMYTVVFGIRDLFGTPTRDEVTVEVHEEWLEPIGS